MRKIMSSVLTLILATKTVGIYIYIPTYIYVCVGIYFMLMQLSLIA